MTEESQNLTLLNYMAQVSQVIVVCSPDDLVPISFGCGCIVEYKKKRFILSVAHVTDLENMIACIETNVPTGDISAQLYKLGSMYYFDQYTIGSDLKSVEVKKFDNLGLIFDEQLDITFCEVNECFAIIQPEWDFGAFKIEKGNKSFAKIDMDGTPDPNLLYGFCGRIKHRFNGASVISEPKFVFDLKYSLTNGRFHIFSTTETITDAKEYKGCSGAPIIDENGKLVGLVSSVLINGNAIFAFSIEECKRLLDCIIH